jgi:cysteine desulfurase
MDRIYLDYAASTPVNPEVMKAMQPYFSKQYGNPGSVHSFGQEAQKGMDEARTSLAKDLGVDFEEIIFTSSASESNDLIIDGIFEGSTIQKPKIIVSDIEHESVIATAEALTSKGAEVVVLPVSKGGFVNPDELRELLDERTILVSIIYASNEIGTIQPIREIGDTIKAFRQEHGLRYPLFHTDAVQAVPFIKISPKEFGIDSLTLSSQKIYGPKGAGCLYLSKEYLPIIRPQLIGGAHEFGLRASTPNVPAIVGFGKAVELIAKDRGKNAKESKVLRDQLLEGIRKIYPNIEVNGSMENRLPNNLNVYFPGQEESDLVVKFDMQGIAVSTGSACSVRATKLAKVVLALGFGEERAKASVRFSLGELTTKKEVEKAIKAIEKAL